MFWGTAVGLIYYFGTALFAFYYAWVVSFVGIHGSLGLLMLHWLIGRVKPVTASFLWQVEEELRTLP